MNVSRATYFVAIFTCSCLYSGAKDALAGTINVAAGTITGLGAGTGAITFEGISGGVATFIINGDLNVDANDVVSVTNNPSNAAISLLVGNDANIGLNSLFNFNAV